MKLILAFVLGFGIFSCKESEDPITQSSLQYFLVGIQPSWAPNMDFIPVSDSLYYYQFNDDGTFLKRVGDQTAKGTFKDPEIEDFDGIVLTFEDQDSDLIHSCFRGEEYLNNLGNNELSGTWQACDGPTHFFKAIYNPNNLN
ncbi:hypothetical protein [Algoriphagus marinus]|uniref:hypothetical protein n=1 Tax=Algoriphagus marinus TaxID=1925762 RepID=UPI0011152144|nr:hypothetical protein [Algoriphagus marinus]